MPVGILEQLTDEEAPVTIKEIQDAVPVSDRSIRSWVQQGLLPKPVKIGLGRAVGTVSYYPSGTVEKALLIYRVRKAGQRSSLKRLVQRVGDSKVYIGIGEDGLITLSYIPKSFQDDQDDQDEEESNE